MTAAFDAEKARRPKPTLPDGHMFGPIASYFASMRHHDLHGHTWTRDAIGAYLAQQAGGDTPTD